MFRVTRQWLRQHASGNGGWTRAQLAAIGVSWPPPKGWVDSLIGSEIEERVRDEFERLCNRENLTRERAEAAVRHEQMKDEVYYTWPIPGGYAGSHIKPDWWPK